MKRVRGEIFETNSSSTHSLVFTNNLSYDSFLPKSSMIMIDFVNTDDEYGFYSLRDKVSYLVAHIIRNYKYDVPTYEDLIGQVKEDSDFKRIERYVKENYNKDIVFPTSYDGDLEDIVEVNHQLIRSDFNSVLSSLLCNHHDLLDDVLSPSTYIKLGRD